MPAKKHTATKTNEDAQKPIVMSDHVLRVLGYLAIKDLDRLEDQIEILVRLGFGNQEIAIICGTTTNTVAVRKHGLKAKARKGQ